MCYIFLCKVYLHSRICTFRFTISKIFCYISFLDWCNFNSRDQVVVFHGVSFFRSVFEPLLETLCVLVVSYKGLVYFLRRLFLFVELSFYLLTSYPCHKEKVKDSLPPLSKRKWVIGCYERNRLNTGTCIHTSTKIQ